MQLADNGLTVKRINDSLVISRRSSIMELLMLNDADKTANDWVLVNNPIPTYPTSKPPRDLPPAELRQVIKGI